MPRHHAGENLHRAARRLLTAALLLLAVTAAGGAVEGLDAPAGGDGSLHVTAGTIGFLTLGVLAAVAWLFSTAGGPTPRPVSSMLLGWCPIGAVGAYVLGSWLWSAPIRIAGAALALAAVLGFAAAVTRAVRATTLTVPRSAALAALAIVIVSLALDLIPDVEEISQAGRVPFRVAGARSPSIAAFAILIGMALAEQRLAAPRRPVGSDMWGLTQILLFLTGWLSLLIGTALDDLTLLVGNVSLHALAVIVFLGRIGSRLTEAFRSEPVDTRWFGLSLVYLAAYVGLLGNLALGVAGGTYRAASEIPAWVVFAVDHTAFVTAAAPMLGLALLAGRRPADGAAWMDHTAFWGLNLGLVGFVAARAAGTATTARWAAAALAIATLAATAAGLRALSAAPAPDTSPG